MTKGQKFERKFANGHTTQWIVDGFVGNKVLLHTQRGGTPFSLPLYTVDSLVVSGELVAVA